MSSENFIKGQGAQRNEINRFDKYTFEPEEDDFLKTKTTFTEVFPKTIVNEVKSPDIRMEYSLNPYQGCEHGCSYCFARPTHEFWGYSAGTDFERKIMVKKNAPELLEKFFQKRNYVPKPSPFQVIPIVTNLQKGNLKSPENYLNFVWNTGIRFLF